MCVLACMHTCVCECIHICVFVCMVGAGNFGRKLQATISDAPYKYMGLSEIVACNFRPKLPAPTICL